MSRRKQSQVNKNRQRRRKETVRKNKTTLKALLDWFIPEGELFIEKAFHGNVKWSPEQLAAEAVVWSWQESENVTDAFEQTLEICDELGLKNIACSYTSMMNGLTRYGEVFTHCLRERYQSLAEETGGRFWKTDSWVLIGFDGSRATAPRTVSNEQAFCAPGYGSGNRAKYGKKKSKGLRRRRNKQNKPQPQAPQIWVTMMWHMQLRAPWTWRLGPSNSSERGHVMEMLQQEEFPENTLFCGDAGFVGYPLWSTIMSSGADFLVRVGANVKLLSEHADIKKCGGGEVLCWPKGKINSGAPPLRLRLLQVKVGKTKMWMLTSVLSRRELSAKQAIRYYKMRWGIEVEFRGLKQTVGKRKLRCRNSARLLVELDWSIRAMAVAELLALREQISIKPEISSDAPYDPKRRSLANTMRSLRTCMRNLHKFPKLESGLLYRLSQAMVQTYNKRTSKNARYRPKNPDKQPLGEPTVRKMKPEERERLEKLNQEISL